MGLVSEDEFLALGFQLIGNRNIGRSQRSTQILEFKSLYGPSPLVMSHVWTDLQTKLGVESIAESSEPKILLIMYRWLKSYLSEPQLKNEFGGMAVKTIRKYCKLVYKLALLRTVKIDPNWNKPDGGLRLNRTVDGIHYPITEPRPFSTDYSSHKLGKKAGLAYEFCIATDRDEILWIGGPFPAGTGDKAMFESALMQKIRELQIQRNDFDIRVIADDGYIKEALRDTLTYRNEFDPREIAYFKDRALSRHERLNGLTRRFDCLNKPFHSDRSSDNSARVHPAHKACLEAICVTIQYELDVGDTSLIDPYPS